MTNTKLNTHAIYSNANCAANEDSNLIQPKGARVSTMNSNAGRRWWSSLLLLGIVFSFGFGMLSPGTVISQTNPYYPNNTTPPTIQQTTNDSTGAIEINICVPDAIRLETFNVYKEVYGVKTLIGSGTLESGTSLFVSIPYADITDGMILEVTSQQLNSNVEFIEWRDTVVTFINLDIGVIHNDILSYVFSHNFEDTTTYDFMESAVEVIHEYFEFNDIMNDMNMHNISTEAQHFILHDILDTTHGIPYLDSELWALTSIFRSGSLQQYTSLDEIAPSVREIFFALMTFNEIFTQDFTDMQEDEVFDAIIQKANYYQSISSNNIVWDSKEGYIANACLSVARNSALYWKDFVNDLDNDDIPEPNLLPAVVAFDVAGAIAGAAKEVIGAKLSNQKITGKNVVKGALIGAATGSLGIAAKGLKVLSKLFRR